PALLRRVHRVPRDAAPALPVPAGRRAPHPPPARLPRARARLSALRGVGGLGEGEPPAPAAQLTAPEPSDGEEPGRLRRTLSDVSPQSVGIDALTLREARGSLPATCAEPRSSAPWGPPPTLRRCWSVS